MKQPARYGTMCAVMCVGKPLGRRAFDVGPAGKRKREWLRAWFCRIALRVAIDRRRRWASFIGIHLLKKEREKKKEGKTGRSKKELVSLPSVPVCLSLSLRVEVSGFKSLIRLELVGEKTKN